MDLESFTDQTVVNRKTAISGGLVALAALALPGQLRAQAKAQPDDSFVVLLKGLYQPVTRGPNLGLSLVDLNDGSYSTTRIYPVSGTPGNKNADQAGRRLLRAVQRGPVRLSHPRWLVFDAVYRSQRDFCGRRAGGRFLEGTFELTILEETGIYKPFAGGHNHMVDRLHFLAPGDGSGGIDEYCFCFISR